MKKIFYFASLLTALVGAASCEKIETSHDQLQPSGEYRQVTIIAGPVQAKTSVNNGILTWSDNDELNIVPQTGSIAAASLAIKSGAGTASGTFEGTVDASIKDDTDLYGWCGGDWTYNSGSFSVNMPAAQTYVENGLSKDAYPSIGTGSITGGINLSNPMGVLKLTVKGATSDCAKSITVTSASKNLAGEFSIDKSSYAVSGGSSKTITLNIATPVALSSTGVKFYVVLPPATYPANDLTITVTMSDSSISTNTLSSAVTIEPNNTSAKDVNAVNTMYKNALIGKFSVSSTKTVNFSKGNLYYDGTAFNFENSQAAYPATWSTSHVGNFYWSNSASVAIAETYSDPAHLASDIFFTNSPTDESAPNSGFTVDGVSGIWRVLSISEWQYLLNSRTGNRYAYAKVDGNNGMLIFPDGYTGTTSGTGIAATNTETNYPTSSIPAATWTTMENAGCVFLNATGERNGNSFWQSGNYGSFWSSNAYDDSGDHRAFLFRFANGYFSSKYGSYIENSGYSVRLVCAAK